MATVQILLLLAVVAMSSALPTLQYPIHASCSIKWTFPSTSCATVNEALLDAAGKMQGDAGCATGGEKCLYTVKSHSSSKLTLVHETPKKHYKDDLTINFQTSGSGCTIEAKSSSETWYAYLDNGTNYCNLRNLLDAADMETQSGFTEQTSDSVCTQYSSKDCTKY